MRPANDRPSAQGIRRYALFQLPGVALIAIGLALLDGWFDLAGWIWAAVLGGWVAKDVALFPFLWRAYDDRQRAHSYSLLGARGVALGRIDPAGRVRVKAERWRAELVPGARPVPDQAPVLVVDRRGLTLQVRAEADPEEARLPETDASARTETSKP